MEIMTKLWGLREGLQLAKRAGMSPLEVECDSLILVNAVNDDVGSNHPTKYLISKCRTLMKELRIHKANHILREANQCADNLADLGKHATEGVHVLSHPPEELSKLLRFHADGYLRPRKFRTAPCDGGP